MDKVIEFSHNLISNVVTKDDTTLDLTVGNGNDTLFLAAISKQVIGFDIQEVAINNTKKKLEGYDNVTLYLDSHENLDKYNLENIKAIIMNLGYLPKGDKNITTMAKSSLNALKKALKALMVTGIMVIVIYKGHQEGYKESIKIRNYVKKLDQKYYQVLQYEFINQINNPPYVIAIEKIKDEDK